MKGPRLSVVFKDAIDRGLTLEQVKAAKLTADYDSRYSTPNWTTDMFVEAVYKSLRG